MIVWPRVDEDLDALQRVAAAIQTRDGYPVRRPMDLRAFMQATDALAAWVALLDDEVVGHVALHRSSLPVVMARAAEVIGHARLAVVARLLVAPASRGAGVGRALLDRAADDARARGLHPILDVVADFAPARSLYESAGWVDAGAVTMRFGDDLEVVSHVYVAP